MPKFLHEVAAAILFCPTREEYNSVAQEIVPILKGGEGYGHVSYISISNTLYLIDFVTIGVPNTRFTGQNEVFEELQGKRKALRAKCEY